jgi:hypothetical protein
MTFWVFWYTLLEIFLKYFFKVFFALITNFEARHGLKAQKIKIAFYKCCLDLKLAAIDGSALSIFFKKININAHYIIQK